jgi:hypothetical protein
VVIEVSYCISCQEFVALVGSDQHSVKTSVIDENAYDGGHQGSSSEFIHA